MNFNLHLSTGNISLLGLILAFVILFLMFLSQRTDRYNNTFLQQLNTSLLDSIIGKGACKNA